MSKNIKIERFTHPQSFQPMSRIIIELPMEITDPSVDATAGYKKLGEEITRLLTEYKKEFK